MPLESLSEKGIIIRAMGCHYCEPAAFEWFLQLVHVERLSVGFSRTGGLVVLGNAHRQGPNLAGIISQVGRKQPRDTVAQLHR